MIDYRTHSVALSGFLSSLATEAFVDPSTVGARDQLLSAVGKEPGLAALGSLIDHLLRHASTDGTELDLLERAATLWQSGLTLFSTLSSSRAGIESSLLNPADPTSADVFNSATENMRLQGLEATTKLDEVEAFRQEVMKLAHIPEHPRQLDRTLSDWDWGNIFLARRTDAFVRTVFNHAGETELQAFAVGVLSSYTSNACGSAYLGQVVGGPRRSHRFRDRIAANSVGSWFALSNPDLRNLSDLARLIRLGDSSALPVLPSAVEELIEKALADTYDLAQTPPLPDLQLGYRRLIRHLELLDMFNMPALPANPGLGFQAALYGDPTKPPTTIFTIQASNFADGPGQGQGLQPTNYSGGSGGIPSPTTTDSAPTTGERCGSFWMGIIYAIMFLGGGFAPCIGAWAEGDRCKLWDAIWKEFGDANKPSQEQMDSLAAQSQPLTGEEIVIAAGLDQMTDLVGNMYDLHTHVWEALAKARAFLAVFGMLYPDEMLNGPLYKQFLAVPGQVLLPRLPESDPAPNYHRFPTTPAENPVVGWSPYPTGSSPAAIINGVPGASPFSASMTAVRVWWQIVNGFQDSQNYDLDADRGSQHPCWNATGSITDNPIGVVNLAYQDT